ARTLLDGLRADRDAALRERDDHLPRRTVEAHRLPIVAALGARAAVDPLSDLVLDDVLSVARPSGFTVEALPDVLEDRLDMVDVAAVATIELPQNAVLADGEDELVVARVDEHALEHDVEIERFARCMREVPRELARARVQRDGRARVERDVERAHAAARRHPRLRLRRAPVREVELRIVAAGDPCLAARAIEIRQIAPRVAAGIRRHGDRRGAPQLLARVGVVAADETLLLLVTGAAAHPLDHDAVRDERPAAARAAVGHRGVPHGLAGPRVERDEAAGALQVELVAVERHAAHRDVVLETMLPDEAPVSAVERLDDAPGVVQEDRAAIGEGRWLIRAAVAHRPDPGEL